MALTFSVVKRLPSKALGGHQAHVVDITLDNAYPTGGWAVTAANCGLRRNLLFLLLPGAGKAGGVLSWDETNKKIMARDYTGTELTNGSTAMNGVTIRSLALGD